ncbi:MAG TPA: hypothetical protein GX497_08745 [Bacillus bacterium]|nr:hypothetical protein [Bacillus sp. (in: firmicutes)]
MKVNGFIIEKNNNEGNNANLKDYLVFHPLYDGFFMVHDTNTLSEATSWCEEQDFENWTNELSAVTIW